MIPKRMRDEIIDKFSSVPRNLRIVAVGTTQCHFALAFEQEQCSGFNMACYLNSMPFSRLLLEKYENHIAKGAVILITLQYPIFCINEFEGIAKKNVQQYAKILPYKNPYCSIGEQMGYWKGTAKAI